MADRAQRVVLGAPDDGVKLSISNDVLEEIAWIELADTDGVAVSHDRESGGLFRRHGPPGVQVEVADRDVVFHLKFGVYAGVGIPDVATTVRERIAQAVHSKTGYMVRAVHVLVDQVVFEEGPPGVA